ncbi:MAG TPA: hypothetical protein VFR03_02520, partial [Thermoanaerobaculia bacterium]|nr:hypothetical protein [Thermoanaerobaculia bacterium]
MSPLALRSRKTLSLFSLLFLSLLSATYAAQWRPIGPEGASIRSLAGAPGGRVYALTSGGRLYGSSDGAAAWSPVRSDSPAFRKLVADPSHPEVLYGLTFAGSLAKSVDGGATWSDPLLTGFLWTFQIAPSSPDVLYAARDQEILKSTDGGASWAPTSFAGKPAFVLAVDPSNPLVVYAGVPDGVLRSDDGGATWTALQGPGIGLGDLAIVPRQPATLYGLSYDEVLKSTDRGASWSRVWKAPADSFIFPQKLAIDPVTGTVYMLDRESGVYSSTDGGASWPRTLSLYGANDLAVDGQTPGRVYVGTDAGGVYRSDDRGGTWAVANHGLRELAFTAVAADPHTRGVLFAIANPDPSAPLAFGPQFLLRSADGGATWSSPFGDP